jgi:hypothetical protein
MPKNKFTVKECRKLYFSAFPRPEKCIVVWTPVNSGHNLKIYHNNELVDEVLVRYDRKIFRDYIQVFPEVS